MSTYSDIQHEAERVLAYNYTGNYTVPASELYPHQWLWDSCFTAIGLRHLDIDIAQTEILNLLRGQWHNGMIPNMIFAHGKQYHRERSIWRSWVNPNSPDDVHTSGITQPPMLAEAIVKVGARLKKTERRTWYKKTYPALVKYHQWLYKERDPHNEGLVLQIHPWETGLDNTPPWMNEIKKHQLPLWISAVDKLGLKKVINFFRRDTKLIPAEQRIDVIDALLLFSTQRRLRRKGYDIDRILTRSLFAIEDLSYNCIFIRANKHLQEIADFLGEELDEELLQNMKKTEKALNELWDPYTGQYYSRNFVTHKLLKEPTIATLLPLYAGTITKEKADQLVKLLENEHSFGTNFAVPSVPLNSPWFSELGYWQGPVWVNTNWLIIDGLERMGYHDHAEALKESTIDMVAEHGCYEYFSAKDGKPAGAANFSWTAALIVDLIKSK